MSRKNPFSFLANPAPLGVPCSNSRLVVPTNAHDHVIFVNDHHMIVGRGT